MTTSVQPPSYVVTISGPSGAGKSSLVRAVADMLGDASSMHFDDYGALMEQPPDGHAWIAAGADLAAFILPQFGADVARLRAGETVTTPTGRVVSPARYLVIEEPFGRGRADMRDQVDFSVCIDAPMEIALARRLLDVTEKWTGTAEERLAWINGYLKAYLFEKMREVYIAINNRVIERSDLVVDGQRPVEENAKRIIDAFNA